MNLFPSGRRMHLVFRSMGLLWKGGGGGVSEIYLEASGYIPANTFCFDLVDIWGNFIVLYD